MATKPRTSEVGQAVLESLREVRPWQRAELSPHGQRDLRRNAGRADQSDPPQGGKVGMMQANAAGLTADTALRLARFFGTTPEFWVSLQATHDLTKARAERGAAIERDVRPRAA